MFYYFLCVSVGLAGELGCPRYHLSSVASTLSPFPVSCANSRPHTESRFSHCYLKQWEWGSSPLFHLEQVCFYVYRRPFQVSFSCIEGFSASNHGSPLIEFWGGHKLKLPAEGSTGLSLSLALRSGSQCTFPSFSGKNDPGGNFVCLQPGASTRTQGLPIQPVTYRSDRRKQGGRRDAGGALGAKERLQRQRGRQPGSAEP